MSTDDAPVSADRAVKVCTVCLATITDVAGEYEPPKVTKMLEEGWVLLAVDIDANGFPSFVLGRTDGVVWRECATCERPIFAQTVWSHEGGTPPLDHDAEPVG